MTGPAFAARLQGEYLEANGMYRRGGTDRAEWIQFSGSVLNERLGEDGKPVDQDALARVRVRRPVRQCHPGPGQ